jgi:hypothetical protein
MTVYDKSFIGYAMFVFMCWQVVYQTYRFSVHKTINHKWHSVLYGIVAVLACVPFLLFSGWRVALKLLFIAALERLALYDFLLNWMRDKRPLLTYNGKGTTGSWLDSLENSLPEKWLLMLKIGYIIAFLCAIIFIK